MTLTSTAALCPGVWVGCMLIERQVVKFSKVEEHVCKTGVWRSPTESQLICYVSEFAIVVGLFLFYGVMHD